MDSDVIIVVLQNPLSRRCVGKARSLDRNGTIKSPEGPVPSSPGPVPSTHRQALAFGWSTACRCGKRWKPRAGLAGPMKLAGHGYHHIAMSSNIPQFPEGKKKSLDYICF